MPATRILPAALLLAAVSGCAALHPISGTHVEELPCDTAIGHRAHAQDIDLTLLGQTPPADYRLAAGDVVGVFVEGIIGADKGTPPVTVPRRAEEVPAMGYPVQVNEAGQLILPVVGALSVNNMTLAQAANTVRQAYIARKLVNPDNGRVFVGLVEQRKFRVLVIREDIEPNGFANNNGPVEPVNPNGRGQLVILPAYRNDVLNALTESGGLPADRGDSVVYVLHRRRANGVVQAGVGADDLGFANGQVVAIPTRILPGEAPSFAPHDVMLDDGDVVLVRSRKKDYFYTGGLLGGGKYQLPRDEDLDILKAISLVQSRQPGNGATRTIGGPSALNQDVSVGASRVVILRKHPCGREQRIEVDLHRALRDPRQRAVIQPGDFVILRYTKMEAAAAFFERFFLENIIIGSANSAVFGQ